MTTKSLVTLFLIHIQIQIIQNADFTTCARDRSRIVRKQFEAEILPLYHENGVSVPSTCELNSNRDMYLDNELNKFEESGSKWVCRYCGKAFYEQRFLDMHFTHRHSNHIRQGPNMVCLADLCDIFRCEVIVHKNEPKYWDRALCLEKELKEYREQCYAVVKHCIPDSLEGLEHRLFHEKLNKSLCSYLTCEEYWVLPNPGYHPVSLALYIVGTSMLLFGLMIYYYVAYTHFYTDDSLLVEPKEEKNYRVDPRDLYSPPLGEMRYRSAIPGLRR